MRCDHCSGLGAQPRTFRSFVNPLAWQGALCASCWTLARTWRLRLVPGERPLIPDQESDAHGAPDDEPFRLVSETIGKAQSEGEDDRRTWHAVGRDVYTEDGRHVAMFEHRVQAEQTCRLRAQWLAQEQAMT